jgi:predicted 3-demethylubiquinone-9 3-methyltransferase (glyoxalase superfamily)
MKEISYPDIGEADSPSIPCGSRAIGSGKIRARRCRDGRPSCVLDPTTLQKEEMMQKITPCLWFDDQLEEAIEFYGGIFKDVRVTRMKRRADGKAFFANFELAGQTFMALNGGPHFKFNEAISLFVDCKDQAEVDYYWERLMDGGRDAQCGWLKDRFGLSWQIVPEALIRYMNDEDGVKAKRVQDAMMQMVKIDVAELDRAYRG